MKMRARVRATSWLEFETDAPDAETQPHPQARTNSPGQILVNEATILDARRAAAEKAEQLAAARFPNADVLVEEVTEA